MQLQTALTSPPPPPAPLPKFAFIMHISNECVMPRSRAASAPPTSPSHAACACVSRSADTLCAAVCVIGCVVAGAPTGDTAAGPQHDVSVGEQHAPWPRDRVLSACDGVGTGVNKAAACGAACRDGPCDLQYALPGAIQVGLKTHTPTMPLVHAQFSHPSNHLVQPAGHVVDDARDELHSGGIRAACSSASTAAQRGGGIRVQARTSGARSGCMRGSQDERERVHAEQLRDLRLHQLTQVLSGFTTANS